MLNYFKNCKYLVYILYVFINISKNIWLTFFIYEKCSSIQYSIFVYLVPTNYILYLNIFIVYIIYLVLVRKYSQVVQRYYVQYLVGFDAIQLAESIQSMYGNQANQQYFLQDPSYIIFQSIIRTISGLSVKQGIRDYEIIIT